MINNNTMNLKLQHYLSTIKSWCFMFDSVKFIFRNRESNVCADMLAKKAISCNSH